jgi:hypothetical protein
MSHHEEKQAEHAQQQESVKDLRRFARSVISHFPVCPVPVIEGQKRLDNSRYPEETYQTGNEQEHFPGTDLSPGKMAFCKNNADNQEDSKLQQLKQLQSRDIVY